MYSANDLSDSRECLLIIGVHANATGINFTRLATGNDLAAVKALSQGSSRTKPPCVSVRMTVALTSRQGLA